MIVLPSRIKSLGDLYAQDDRVLLHAPIETELTDHVQNQKVLLVLGSKGTGKTAIPTIIKAKSRSRVAVINHIIFHELPWFQLIPERLKKESSPTRVQWMRDKWKFTLLLHLLQVIYHQQGSYPITNAKAREKIKSILEGAGLIEPRSSIQLGRMFSALLSRLSQVEVLGYFGFSLNEQSIEKSNYEIRAKVDQFLDLLVASPLDRRTHLLFLDELDFSEFTAVLDREVYDDLICAAIQGSYDIFQFFRENGRDVRVVNLLREDIWARLRFPMQSQIESSFTARFKWSPAYVYRGSENWSLRNLIEKRLSYALGRSVDWNDVFEDGARAFDDIMSRTLFRPRDFIAYCEKTIEVRNQNRGAVGKISKGMIGDAELPYSKVLWREITTEMASQIDIAKLEMVFKEMGTRRFEKEKFTAACNEHKLVDRNPNDYLRILFESSVISYTTKGGSGGGGGEIARYKDTAAPFAIHTSYDVHFGLLKALGLRKGKTSFLHSLRSNR